MTISGRSNRCSKRSQAQRDSANRYNKPQSRKQRRRQLSNWSHSLSPVFLKSEAAYLRIAETTEPRKESAWRTQFRSMARQRGSSLPRHRPVSFTRDRLAARRVSHLIKRLSQLVELLTGFLILTIRSKAAVISEQLLRLGGKRLLRPGRQGLCLGGRWSCLRCWGLLPGPCRLLRTSLCHHGRSL